MFEEIKQEKFNERVICAIEFLNKKINAIVKLVKSCELQNKELQQKYTALKRITEGLNENSGETAVKLSKLSNKFSSLKRDLFKDINKIKPLNVNIKILDDLIIYIATEDTVYLQDVRNMIRSLSIDKKLHRKLLESLDEYQSQDIEKDDFKKKLMEIRTEIECPQSKKRKRKLKEELEETEPEEVEEPQEQEKTQPEQQEEQPEEVNEEQTGEKTKTKKEQIIDLLSSEPDKAFSLKEIAEKIGSKESNTARWLKELRESRDIKKTKNGWKIHKKSIETKENLGQ